MDKFPNRTKKEAVVDLPSCPVILFIAIKHPPTRAVILPHVFILDNVWHFLLLTSSGEMGPDCRLWVGEVPCWNQCLVPLANSWMAPCEWEPLFSSTVSCWSFSGAGARKTSLSRSFLRCQFIRQFPGWFPTDEEVKLKIYPYPWGPQTHLIHSQSALTSLPWPGPLLPAAICLGDDDTALPLSPRPLYCVFIGAPAHPATTVPCMYMLQGWVFFPLTPVGCLQDVPSSPSCGYLC